jgi:hypothetical protein
MEIRKMVIVKEVIEADGLGEACAAITRVVAMAVVRNPCAGHHVDSTWAASSVSA